MSNIDKAAIDLAQKNSSSISDIAKQVNTGLDISSANVARSISVTLDESIVKQNYLGGYIEIQPDSWDGEVTATDGTTKTWGFPVSLLPSERARIKNDVFHGNGKNIMFIRFPLGFAYRGFRNIDSGSSLAKNIGERFKGQNATLKAWFDKISLAGGGLAPEYWCPPPYWVTSGSYGGNNQLRAGGSYSMTTTLVSIKASDATQYNAQIAAFTDAIVNDLEYLHQNIAPVRMFGLQNEPQYGQHLYGACQYDAQTYNDVLTVLYPKIQASTILSVFNDEPNTVKLLVASSDESNPFAGVANIFISSHPDWIWGYTHHTMRKASGEDYTDGADWYKTTEFATLKGSKANVFINEYEYFNTNFGTDDFRCSNNMLHLINEAVYGEAQVLHPVIHICKPIGQTLSSTNTRGYCLFKANLSGDYGVNVTGGYNSLSLNKGTVAPNPTMYNAWAMFGDNLPVGAYLVGSYTTQIAKAGWCVYKYNGKLYIFAANNSADDVSISVTFGASKQFDGKMYNATCLGSKIKSKSGTTIQFVIPAYSGQVWIESDQSTVTNMPADTTAPSAPTNLSSSNLTSSGVTVSWSASTDNVGVTGYKVYRDTVEVGSVTTTTFNDSGLTASTTYSYTVKAYDSASNLSSASSSLSVTTSATVPLNISDTFNRADSNTTLGNTETGQTWQYEGLDLSVWGIESNKAKCVTGGSNGAFAIVDSNESNCSVSADFVFGSYSSLSVRHTDRSNQIRLRLNSSGLGLFKVVSDSAVSIGSYSITPVVGTTYNLKIVMNGSTIEVYLDGVLRITGTTTVNQTATKHGFFTGANNTSERYDNFKIESIS